MSYTAYPTDLNQPAADLLAFVEGKECCKKRTLRAAYEVVGVGLGYTVGYDPAGGDPCPCPAPAPAPDVPDLSHEEKVACLKACSLKRGPIGDWLKTPQGQQLIQTALSIILSLA